MPIAPPILLPRTWDTRKYIPPCWILVRSQIPIADKTVIDEKRVHNAIIIKALKSPAVP